MTIFDFVQASKARLDRFERQHLFERLFQKEVKPPVHLSEGRWWEVFDAWDPINTEVIRNGRMEIKAGTNAEDMGRKEGPATRMP